MSSVWWICAGCNLHQESESLPADWRQIEVSRHTNNNEYTIQWAFLCPDCDAPSTDPKPTFEISHES